MYVVFARKYRPQRFEEVVGQDHIARTLQNAVQTDRVAHAYLFCGSRGVGKTTMARILAKALNCAEGPTPDPCCECESCRRIATGDDIDVMEIDGASNNSVDQVRELRQNVRLAPSHSRFKVYYIDEVHMLSDSAFNALLKTLEEPPAHVKFIFATTEPQKLPETVKSRCQRFDFRRISDADIVGTLREVSGKEGLQMQEGAAAMIARAARGSMRDALGTLDQLAAFGEEVRMEDVLDVLGAVDARVLERLVDAVAGEDAASALQAAHEALFGGVDVEDFADQLSRYLRDLLVACYCEPGDSLLAGAVADAATLQRQSELFTPEQITYMVQLLREAKLRARRDTTGRIAVELALIKMSRLSELVPLQEALGELSGSGPSGAGRQGSARADGGPAEGSATAATSAIRRMTQTLQESRRQPPAAGEGEGGVHSEAPEGVDEVKFRQAVASAEDPEVAREAFSQQSLRDAFVKADQLLGLNPVRVERTAEEQQEEEEELLEEPGAD
ncbi:MAG: DNA polymerase III subunit gamma/tau [Candidatus Brocadiaceae bacterium]|jgi:DNA polymerase-3 subunit gamma/tau